MREVGSWRDPKRLGPGDHVCSVVPKGAAVRLLVRRWALDGANAGDRVCVFGPEGELGDHDLGRLGVEFADPHRAFLGSGPLVPEAMFEVFRRRAAEAASDGRTLRVVANMDWLLSAPPEADELAAFELRLDEVVAETGSTVVCAYRADVFRPEQIEHLRCIHPLDESSATYGEPPFRMFSLGHDRWAVQGEVDHANARVLDHAVTAAAEGAGDRLRLNLRRLSFVDVGALRALAQAAGRLERSRIVLEACPPWLVRYWELLDYRTLYPHIELARAA